MATTTQKLGKVGLVDKGVYDETTEYARLDFVTDENNISTYISLVDGNTGHPLTDSVYWRYLAKGKANTPEEVLDLLLQVDGSGSGLDADKLDGTELEEIVNPEALASASPFDFFLGAKQVEVSNEDGTTENKWVFKKMAPAEVATVVAGLIGATNNSLFKQTSWNSGDLNNAPHGVTVIQCWENTSSFTNMPISDRNANAILYTFKNIVTSTATGTAIQFFLHGYKQGVCYFRCLSYNVWSTWTVIS